MRISRLVWLLFWLAGLPAWAQEAGEEDLEVEMFFVPAETVTTASRHAQPVEESPSAVRPLASATVSVPPLPRFPSHRCVSVPH